MCATGSIVFPFIWCFPPPSSLSISRVGFLISGLVGLIARIRQAAYCRFVGNNIKGNQFALMGFDDIFGDYIVLKHLFNSCSEIRSPPPA